MGSPADGFSRQFLGGVGPAPDEKEALLRTGKPSNLRPREGEFHTQAAPSSATAERGRPPPLTMKSRLANKLPDFGSVVSTATDSGSSSLVYSIAQTHSDSQRSALFRTLTTTLTFGTRSTRCSRGS